MNLFLFTGKIVTRPKLSRHRKKDLTQMRIALANNKKGLLSYNVYAEASFKLAHEIFDLYRKDDFIILEGSIKIKSKKIIINKKTSKNKKIMIIKIHKIHPASIIFK